MQCKVLPPAFLPSVIGRMKEAARYGKILIIVKGFETQTIGHGYSLARPVAGKKEIGLTGELSETGTGKFHGEKKTN